MAQNRVEYHIQDGAIFTFKVKAGQTVKIGEIVELTGDREVQTAAANSQKVVGVAYGGTVGKDGVNVGFKGDEGDVVSVVVFKPFVYLTASGAVTAGSFLKAAAAGKAAVHTDAGTYTVGDGKQVFGMAITGAADSAKFIAILL